MKDEIAWKILEELTQIRQALEHLAPPPEPITPPPCPHPIESRVDFGMTNGMADWQCQACGFRTVSA